MYSSPFFYRQFIGSVSDYLIHHLKCSVLVVKDDYNSPSGSESPK